MTQLTGGADTKTLNKNNQKDRIDFSEKSNLPISFLRKTWPPQDENNDSYILIRIMRTSHIVICYILDRKNWHHESLNTRD